MYLQRVIYKRTIVCTYLFYRQSRRFFSFWYECWMPPILRLLSSEPTTAEQKCFFFFFEIHLLFVCWCYWMVDIFDKQTWKRGVSSIRSWWILNNEIHFSVKVGTLFVFFFLLVQIYWCVLSKMPIDIIRIQRNPTQMSVWLRIFMILIHVILWRITLSNYYIIRCLRIYQH